MSLFEFLDRMVEGKPVFDDQSAVKKDSNMSAPKTEESSKATIRKGDDHSFPVVYVKHATTRFNGNKMQVYCRILNTWPEEIMIDKITILGVKREIDDFLNGGEEHEFLVYDGPKVSKQYFEAQLDYKTRREGDYFRSIHDLTFLYHGDDKTYSINEIRLRRPIHDIYG